MSHWDHLKGTPYFADYQSMTAARDAALQGWDRVQAELDFAKRELSQCRELGANLERKLTESRKNADALVVSRDEWNSHAAKLEIERNAVRIENEQLLKDLNSQRDRTSALRNEELKIVADFAKYRTEAEEYRKAVEAAARPELSSDETEARENLLNMLDINSEVAPSWVAMYNAIRDDFDENYDRGVTDGREQAAAAAKEKIMELGGAAGRKHAELEQALQAAYAQNPHIRMILGAIDMISQSVETSPAKNFVELKFDYDGEGLPFRRGTLTFYRDNAKTPGEICNEMKAERDMACTVIGELIAMIRANTVVWMWPSAAIGFPQRTPLALVRERLATEKTSEPAAAVGDVK